MRAVWSFWSEPCEAGACEGWSRQFHHQLAWGLSLDLARRHYPETQLVTDTHGRELLVDRLGLEFTHVSTALDGLCGADPALWALGKLVAHTLQERPFVHIDSDVFLWRALPARLASAPVLAQNPERWSHWDMGCGAVEHAFTRRGFELPDEWEWARSYWGDVVHEANCGIVGGTNVEFLRHYARTALALATDPGHAPAWRTIDRRDVLPMIIEQFMLSACHAYHRFNPRSPFRGIQLRYLFPSMEASYDSAAAKRLGFTHLMAGAKRDDRVVQRLEQRMERDYPDFYRRCLALAS